MATSTVRSCLDGEEQIRQLLRPIARHHVIRRDLVVVPERRASGSGGGRLEGHGAGRVWHVSGRPDVGPFERELLEWAAEPHRLGEAPERVRVAPRVHEASPLLRRRTPARTGGTSHSSSRRIAEASPPPTSPSTVSPSSGTNASRYTRCRTRAPM